jgi:hypothetical protein
MLVEKRAGTKPEKPHPEQEKKGVSRSGGIEFPQPPVIKAVG